MVINEGIKPHDIRVYVDCGDYYRDAVSGEYFGEIPKSRGDFHIVVDLESVTEYADFVYDSKNDVLVVFHIKINTFVWSSKEVIEVFERYDIKRNKKIMHPCIEYQYDAAGVERWEPIQKKYIVQKMVLESCLLFFLNRCTYNSINFIGETLKIFPDYYILPGNRIVRMESPIDLYKYLSLKEPSSKKTGTKKQERLLGNLLSLSLPSMDGNRFFSGLPQKYSIIHRAGEYCVVRTFLGRFEGARIYIGRQSLHVLMKKNDGRYVLEGFHRFFCESARDFVVFCGEYKDSCYSLYDSDICDTSGTRLDFIMDFIMSLNPDRRLHGIIGLLMDPRIEKLAKSEFGSVLKDIFNHREDVLWDSPYRVLNKLFSLNNDATGLYQWLGINRYQAGQIIRMAKDCCGDYTSALLHTKQFLCPQEQREGFSIAHVDNHTFDRVFGFFYSSCNIDLGCICDLSPYVSRKKMLRLLQCYDEFKKKTEGMAPFEKMGCLLQWRDYISVVVQLKKIGDCPERFVLFCRDPDQIGELHDQAVSYHTFASVTYKQYSFDELRIYWEKYRFECGDYVVRIPSNPQDIMDEGKCLKHCVATYIEPIAEGKSIIVFIREKSNPDVPFYTVEISTDGTIQQVHGSENSNVSPGSQLMDFINQWALNKNLKIGNINQVR